MSRPEKSTRKVLGGVTGNGFKPGPNPKRGRGPKKGAPNAGRPPLEHINWCKEVVSDPAAEAAVKAILRNPKHPQFASLWAKIADRGYGTAPQKHEHMGKDGAPLPPAVIRVEMVTPRAGDG